MEKLPMSHEDYLEAIVMLGGTDRVSVRSVDIARQLDVSKASVSKPSNALKEKGLVVQAYYSHITLTQQGYQYPHAVLDRHHMLKKFLISAIGIDEETAEHEACLMEHAISEDSFAKWRKFIKGLNLK